MLLQAKKNKLYHFCSNIFRDHPRNEKENALECYGFIFVFPTTSGFRFSYVNSVRGLLCSDLQRTLGSFTTSVQGKNRSESNQFVWQSEVVFKLMQRHPWGAPNLLFGFGVFFSFTGIVAVLTLHFLINIMNYWLMGYWANSPPGLQSDDLHHQSCREPSLQLSWH